MTLTVYFDGLCQPVNPKGIATYGFVVYRGGERIYRGLGVVGCGALGDDVSNNVAEYTALIKALEWLLENGYSGEEVVVKSDSQLAIYQMLGLYAVRSPRIIPLYERAVELAKKFRKISFRWVPRELNEEADSLSKRAYREFCERNRELVLRHYSRWLATDRQLRYIRALGGEADPFISKREASRLIDRLKHRHGHVL